MLSDEEIRSTLQAYADCDMNMSKAAKQIFLHRNTLVYRMNDIKAQTGMNPLKFHELVSLLDVYGGECGRKLKE